MAAVEQAEAERIQLALEGADRVPGPPPRTFRRSCRGPLVVGRAWRFRFGRSPPGTAGVARDGGARSGCALLPPPRAGAGISSGSAVCSRRTLRNDLALSSVLRAGARADGSAASRRAPGSSREGSRSAAARPPGRRPPRYPTTGTAARRWPGLPIGPAGRPAPTRRLGAQCGSPAPSVASPRAQMAPACRTSKAARRGYCVPGSKRSAAPALDVRAAPLDRSRRRRHPGPLAATGVC